MLALIRESIQKDPTKARAWRCRPLCSGQVQCLPHGTQCEEPLVVSFMLTYHSVQRSASKALFADRSCRASISQCRELLFGAPHARAFNTCLTSTWHALQTGASQLP